MDIMDKVGGKAGHTHCNDSRLNHRYPSCNSLIVLNIPQKNYTPLHIAVISKKHLAVQLLIGYGANVDMKGGPVSKRC